MEKQDEDSQSGSENVESAGQKNDVGDASTSQGLPWYFLPSYIPPGWSGCLVDSLEEIGKPSQMLHSITWLFVSQCPICKANVTQPLQKLNLSKSSAKVDVVNITTPDSQLLYYGWNLLSCLELTLIPLVFFTGIDRYHFGVWHTVTYCLPILQYHGYLTGILPPGEYNFYCFETLFFSNLIKKFHHVTLWMQLNMVLPAMHDPHFLPSSGSLLPLLSYNKTK